MSLIFAENSTLLILRLNVAHCRTVSFSSPFLYHPSLPVAWQSPCFFFLIFIANYERAVSGFGSSTQLLLVRTETKMHHQVLAISFPLLTFFCICILYAVMHYAICTHCYINCERWRFQKIVSTNPECSLHFRVLFLSFSNWQVIKKLLKLLIIFNLW